MGTKEQPGQFDCYEKAAPDEPIFTLLGRDRSAPTLVMEWARIRELQVRQGWKPETDMAKVEEARACALRMAAYQAGIATDDRNAE